MSKNIDGTYTGYIYLITNLANGKHYVGQTTTTIEHRWGQHKSDYNNNNPMYRAFKKYGIENFKIEEVSNYTRRTKEQLVKILNSKEIYYIKKYKSLVTEYGYNLSIGGNNSGIYKGFPIDIYDRNGKLLYECSSATEASKLVNYDVSSIIDCCNGKSIPIREYIFRFKGDNFYKYPTDRIDCVKVYQFDLDGNFIKEHYSMSSAADHVNGTIDGLGQMLRGIRKTYKGYYWNREKVFNYIPPKDVRRPVVQYDLEGNFIKRFDSVMDAKRFYGYKTHKSIESVCNGKTLTAHGFVWRYEGDPYDKYPEIIKFNLNFNSYGKPVDVYTCDGIFVNTFSTMIEASKETNADKGNISACCLGKVKSANGYIFRFHGDPLTKFDISGKTQSQSIYVYDFKGNLIKKYRSKNMAHKELSIGYHEIENICEGKNNHIFNNFILLYKKDNIDEILPEITKANG